MSLAVARKAEAAALFAAKGLPHRRIEEWKYSDLRAALGEAGVGTAQAQWLVGSLPAGMELIDLSQPDPPDWVRKAFARDSENVMSAASLALSASGVALRLPKARSASDALKLDFSGSGHVRALLVVEDGASLTLLEGVGPADFRNVGLEIALGAGARLEHLRISPPGDAAVLVEEASIRIAAGGCYRAHFASFGSKLARMEVRILLEGRGAETHLSGVAVLGAKRHSDVTSQILHLVGDTKSTQLFKHVVADAGRAVYQGKVTVAKGANGSDSSQTAKALLLSDGAEADLKPELEILSDDVKCAHGAAVGDLDAESLFYLCSRGIPQAEARGLLVQAFLEEGLSEISAGDQREMLSRQLRAALRALL